MLSERSPSPKTPNPDATPCSQQPQENVRLQYGDRLEYCDHPYDAVVGADVLAILTEWNQFRNPDFEYIKFKMKEPVIFDGRNLYDPENMRAAGFVYSGIGLQMVTEAAD